MATCNAKPENPTAFYFNQQVREMDYTAISGLPEPLRIDGYELMCRAAQAGFTALLEYWSNCRSLVIVTGPGNNGGDGWVIGKLAIKAGISTTVIFAAEPASESCQKAAADYHAAKGLSQALNFADLDSKLANADLVIDALLGSGFSGALREPYPQLIEAINRANKPVMAIDIPSGLNGDSGVACPTTIKADLTVSFIGATLGLFTADASEFTGEVIIRDLQLPQQVYQSQQPLGHLLPADLPGQLIKQRHGNSCKNHHGHLLLAGGSQNMGGAILLAARAAAASGSGLVSAQIADDYCPAFTAASPGIMFAGWQNSDPKLLIDKANALVVGPGMGQSCEAKALLEQYLDCDLPMVLDADALNLVAKNRDLADKISKHSSVVITPHPGEAARLLNISTVEVQSDRLSAVKLLQQRYNSIAVLKGAGTLIADQQQLFCCPFGNPGMAVAGMGDLLAGIIGSFLAQGYNTSIAAQLGVLVHAQAGDLAAQAGQNGLQAEDLLPHLRGLVNPQC